MNNLEYYGSKIFNTIACDLVNGYVEGVNIQPYDDANEWALHCGADDCEKCMELVAKWLDEEYKEPSLAVKPECWDCVDTGALIACTCCGEVYGRFLSFYKGNLYLLDEDEDIVMRLEPDEYELLGVLPF